MMAWITTLGEQTLKGVEAEFYLTLAQRATAYLWEIVRDLEDEDLTGGVPTGDRLFDLAPINDKIALIHQVLTALLVPNSPSPPINSTLEAAAYFPFALLQQDVQEEVANAEGIFKDAEADLKYTFRKLVWGALEQLELPAMIQADLEEGYDGQLFPERYCSADPSDWEEILEVLENRFFEDRDWVLTTQYPQLLDGIDENLCNELGIDRHYFNNRLPKVSDEEAAMLYQQIQQLQVISDV